VGHDNYKVYTEVAVGAAEKAGTLLLNNFSKERKVSFKGRIDLVTEMDVKSEELIVSYLKQKFPEHGILAEEKSTEESDSEYRWIIDPLDGTTNYAHGFGFWAVSIALEHREEGIVSAAVYAPYLNELYKAQKGQGAFLNGKSIRVSAEQELVRSMVATGFPYDTDEARANLELFKKFILTAQAVRRPGSAAIDLCCVASGKFDGFWEMKLKPWDQAAGFLIVEEAGGKVTDFDGGGFNPYKKKILATNGRIHEKMIEVIKSE